MTGQTLSPDGRTLTVRVPLALRRIGGRKLVVTPDQAGDWAPEVHVDEGLVRAIVRAFRWKRLLDDGVHASVRDLAKAEKVDPSYIARALRMTLLAPEIVEAILDGRQPEGLTLADLTAPLPANWVDQRLKIWNS